MIIFTVCRGGGGGPPEKKPFRIRPSRKPYLEPTLEKQRGSGAELFSFNIIELKILHYNFDRCILKVRIFDFFLDLDPTIFKIWIRPSDPVLNLQPCKVEGFGSGYWPNSDPGLFSSKEGRFKKNFIR